MGTLFVTIHFKGAKAAEWAAKNTILDLNEPGHEEDTGRFKLGDGITPWNELPYFLDEDAIREIVENGGEALPDLTLLYANAKV